MPLTLPEPSAGIADPLTEIGGQLGDLSPEIAGLVGFAQQGPDAVEMRLHEIISEPLAEVDGGDEP
jgi:hypothetical protein